MAEDDGITMAELARRAGMSLSSVRYHADQGHITRLPNGKWNPHDAEPLNGMRQVKAPIDPRSAKLLKVRALGGAVKTRRIKLSVQEAQGRALERQALEDALAARCAEVVQRVATWPARYVALVAAGTDASAELATEILARFTAIALKELGNLHEEAVRHVGQP
jgi:transcriptional regulator with XRE-family HTH domain